MKFDLLGYDRVGVNEIAINPEEAQTVQLIFMMYEAGCDLEYIAKTLNELQRKKHTHYYLDGRVKEGAVDWTATSAKNVLCNEKRCGSVDAQKTVTVNYLDHKAVKNTGQAPRYYAVDQHPAIIEPDEFDLVQKITAANRGGWKDGLQELGIYSDGILAGGVSSIPNWYGFGAEDYNRACLRAYGMSENVLEEIAERINPKVKEEIIETEEQQAQTSELQELPEMMEIDSDDYDNFPVMDIEEEEDAPRMAKESFASWVDSLRERENAKKKSLINQNNFDDIEIGCAELFSLKDKACITLDYRGAAFNKFCFNRLNEGIEDTIMQVELVYNPVEQMLIVRPSKESGPTTMDWAKEGADGKCTMRRACTKGLPVSIFENMGWNSAYKYRVVGRAFEFEGETMLVFFLDRTIKNVPAKPYDQSEYDGGSTDKKKAKRMFMDGFMPDDIELPDLEEFDLGDGPITNQVKNMAKSDAIYFDKQTAKDESELTLEDLGDELYSAERIRYMLQRGLSPQEGWSYLQGMAVIGRNRFTILSEDLVDCFGDKKGQNRDTRLKAYIRSRSKKKSVPTPYGWTVGLDLPTMDTVNETIEMLRQEMAG